MQANLMDPFVAFPLDIQNTILCNLKPCSLIKTLLVSRLWRLRTKNLVDSDQRIRFLFLMNAWQSQIGEKAPADIKNAVTLCIKEMESSERSIDRQRLEKDLRNKKAAITYLFSHLPIELISKVKIRKTPIPLGFENFRSIIYAKKMQRWSNTDQIEKRIKALEELVKFMTIDKEYALAFHTSCKIYNRAYALSFLYQVNCLKFLSHSLLQNNMFAMAFKVALAIPEMVARQDMLDDVGGKIMQNSNGNLKMLL